MTKLTALFLICLTTTVALSSEPVPFTINTKKWSHVLDDHFISITVNPTDLLQGKVYGLAMNSTMAILKGLAPAYVRIGSADSGKYTFKRNRYPSDVVKPDDEYTVTETHWMVFNEVAQSAGLDVIVCLNAAHRSEGTKKWDTRNSLELISFSDSQGYNLTWQLGYEVQAGDGFSGFQFGKDMNRLRTILNAFPRYQQSKLIGPDIRVIHKKEDVDFWNDVLVEAGPILDAVTWHPRWPQPSKMKVSDNSDLGYEFPIDYLEWDKAQLSKILQKTIFKNPVWIGETKRESTGTFAEGLMWARRLVLAAKLGVEVVMKQPNLMDISHPKPEYWIALLHKRLLGRSVLETRSVSNNTDLVVISHCTNPVYWSDKPEKLQDGPVTVFAVNMGGLEQKLQIKGTWSGKSQLLFKYVLTSGSDPDSVFSQMTYLNGEPLMMSDDGSLPDIIPKIKKIERGLTMKLPPYSIGFWVIPEAKVKICQVQPQSIINVETLTPKTAPSNLQDIRDINQFLVEKLTNPESESQESEELKIEPASSESSEKEVKNLKDISLLSKENVLPRVARRIRQVGGMEEINQQLKTIMKETQEFLRQPQGAKALSIKSKLPKANPSTEERIQTIAEGISEAIKSTNQEHEFSKFLEQSGLKQDFGSLLMDERKPTIAGGNILEPYLHSRNPEGEIDEFEVKERRRRSIFSEETIQDDINPLKFGKKIRLVPDPEEGNKNRKQDIVIPHNPDLKGLEERYKSIVHSKIQDGKRKIDDIKRKIKQNETEITQKIKPPEAVNDIQQEIIKKEIELLEKTEETVADILKNQKKRQETFQDLLFDELNDVKGEKLTALREMYKNKDNTIVKRQVQGPFSRPLLKTVEYIEKNFNLEPDSVRKIKRSLEERMGEILRNYDTKKSLESKPRVRPQKEERKVAPKKIVRDEELTRGGKTERMETTKDRPKEKNVVRKSSSQSKSSRRSEESHETLRETGHRGRRIEDTRRKYEDDDDSFELFNETEFLDTVKKPERKRTEDKTKIVLKKASSKTTQKEERREEEAEPEMKFKHKDVEEKKKKIEEIAPETKMKQKEAKEEKRRKETEETKEPEEEPRPLIINDKERREDMLKQITLMVENMNSDEQIDGRSKRRPDDDVDISEEFESDKRTRKIKRKPRRAEGIGEWEKLAEARTGETLESVPSIPAQINKINKLRRIRMRSIRRSKEPKKMKEEETLGEEESSQKKRHLDRPALELEKKKFLKQKIRKISPKFLSHGNDLLIAGKEKDLEVPETVELPETVPQQETVIDQQEGLVKDVEKSAEENTFLEKDTMTSKEKLETVEKELSEGKDNSAETPEPTEGYIVVEPTVEPEAEDEAITEKARDMVEEAIQVEEVKKEVEAVPTTQDEARNELPEEVKEEEKDMSVIATTQTPTEIAPTVESVEREIVEAVKEKIVEPVEEEKKKEVIVSQEEPKSLEALLNEEPPTEPKSGYLSDESFSSEELEEVPPLLIRASGGHLGRAPPKVGLDVSQRKRRATFSPKEEEQDDEEDYSSEERIQKFKQMIYRNSPTKKPLKNEIRSSGMGMGADEFLRMAGSTVRVMFDDVIPEAYGQTKNKIQNMGISEYIKEFGKIVQQMKNLDQIFLNIGEAAVKGYIRGNKAEKGPYIQVISRKKRAVDNDIAIPDEDTTAETETESSENQQPFRIEPDYGPPTAGSSGGATEYGMPGSGEKVGDRVPDRRGIDREAGPPGGDHRERVHQGAGQAAEAPGTPETPKAPEAPRPEGKKEKPETPPPEDKPKSFFDFESLANPIKTLEKLPKMVQRVKENGAAGILRDTGLVRKSSSSISEDLQDKISPWIRTTKDFIQQALTTLQRQRQLSEIIARENINDLMNRDTTKKSIEKREAGNEPSSLPVYRMVSPGKETRKREAREKQSEESLMRQLRGLQPGVYVVPTEEMTNIRSEQITNEAKQKSGLPNVVTLNIYYDKKNPDGKTETTVETSEPKLNQDVLTYYQNKAWKTASDQYDANSQYLSVPDISIPAPVMSPVQMNPALQTSTVFTSEPRVGELPNSRLIQYPTPTYHYPPVQKAYPPLVPNPQPVYNPLYYLPQENRFFPQPPGTKRQWREFKARTGGFPVAPTYDSGWNIQYETVPVRTSSKMIPSSYNKNFKVFSDKKRSVGEFKVDPTWSESALPFWKFFSTSSGDKVEKQPKNSVEKQESEEESSEDLFEENRKRAKAAESKKDETVEEVTEEPEVPEEEEEKSRKRRSLGGEPHVRNLQKRSYPYEFRDHDILPEWFGTYQEIGNSLDHFPAHVRRSHIISTPWSDEDEELLGILDADDELTLVDMNDSDEYYYSNDNTLGHLRRYPRSTDQFENNMIKSNMIYKKPMDGDHVKSKILAMTGIKKLTDEDSSLELVTKTSLPDASKIPESSTTTTTTTTTTTASTPTATSANVQLSSNGSELLKDGINLQPRNPHDDTFYYFFKYAYDSLVKVMKSMTEFF